jgi:hypothetical protein
MMQGVAKRAGLALVLSIAPLQPTSALTVIPPFCLDTDRGYEIFLYEDFYGGLKLLSTKRLQADAENTLVLVSCWDDQMLEVLNPSELTQQQRQARAADQPKPPSAERLIRDAQESENKYSLQDLRQMLRAAGYKARVGNYDKGSCGCALVDYPKE